MDKLFEVHVGDWSEDGHGECKTFYVQANYSAQEMRQAYKDTCKKIGLQMNYNQDYTGIYGCGSGDEKWRHLLTDYEENSIDEKAVEILLEHGYKFFYCNGERDRIGRFVLQEAYFDSKGAFDLFMWFISYSMPIDFEYREMKLESEPINGWWNKELNHQIGYGVFK